MSRCTEWRKPHSANCWWISLSELTSLSLQGMYGRMMMMLESEPPRGMLDNPGRGTDDANRLLDGLYSHGWKFPLAPPSTPNPEFSSVAARLPSPSPPALSNNKSGGESAKAPLPVVTEHPISDQKKSSSLSLASSSSPHAGGGPSPSQRPKEQWLQAEKSDAFDCRQFTTFDPKLTMDSIRQRIDAQIQDVHRQMEQKKEEERLKKERGEGPEQDDDDDEGDGGDEDDDHREKRHSSRQRATPRNSRFGQPPPYARRDNQDEDDDDSDDGPSAKPHQVPRRKMKDERQMQKSVNSRPQDQLDAREWTLLKRIAQHPREAERLRHLLTPRLCQVLRLRWN